MSRDLVHHLALVHAPADDLTTIILPITIICITIITLSIITLSIITISSITIIVTITIITTITITLVICSLVLLLLVLLRRPPRPACRICRTSPPSRYFSISLIINTDTQ